MKQYIIESVSEGGYWSSYRGTFGGILFAEFYNSEEQAWEKAIQLCRTNPGYILTVKTIVR